MSITAYSLVQSGITTVVTVISSLAPPPALFFHWYLDGTYVGKTTAPSKTFVLDTGVQASITAIDTTDPAFDPIANAPAGWPATRTLTFVRCLDSDIAKYRIEQQKNGGAWTSLGFLAHDPRRWNYSFTSSRLDDLASYVWRVIPINAAGNDGTAVTLTSELIVRTPDAPDFSATFNAGTDKITFAAG